MTPEEQTTLSARLDKIEAKQDAILGVVVNSQNALLRHLQFHEGIDHRPPMNSVGYADAEQIPVDMDEPVSAQASHVSVREVVREVRADRDADTHRPHAMRRREDSSFSFRAPGMGLRTSGPEALRLMMLFVIAVAIGAVGWCGHALLRPGVAAAEHSAAASEK